MAENGCPNFRGLFTTKVIKSHVKLHVKSDAQKVNYHKTKSTTWIKIKQLQPTGVAFWTCWRKPMFHERSVRVSTEVENVNVRHIFCLRSLVIAKGGNGSKEIAGRWQNNSFCQAKLCLLGDSYVKFQIAKHWLVKHFAFLKNICYQYLNFVLIVLIVFSRAADWLTTNFLGMYYYFIIQTRVFYWKIYHS